MTALGMQLYAQLMLHGLARGVHPRYGAVGATAKAAVGNSTGRQGMLGRECAVRRVLFSVVMRAAFAVRERARSAVERWLMGSCGSSKNVCVGLGASLRGRLEFQ